MAEWVRALAWNGDRTFPAGFEPHFGKNFSLRNFGNFVYPSLFSSVFRMRPVQWRIVGSRGPGARYIHFLWGPLPYVSTVNGAAFGWEISLFVCFPVYFTLKKSTIFDYFNYFHRIFSMYKNICSCIIIDFFCCSRGTLLWFRRLS